MNVLQLLSTLREAGVRVELDGHELVLKGRTNALSPAQIETIRAQKAALVSLLASARAPDAAIEPARRGAALDPAGRPVDTAPVSFAQQRLWFLDRLEPGNTFYNVPLAARLTGKLRHGALTRALDALAERHEVLRTRFIEVDGEPLQAIDAASGMPLQRQDLSALPDAQRSAAIREALEREAQTPFDLARGPLVRAGLLQLADDDHLLTLTLHHIVADGWSMGVLIDEFARLYQIFAGHPQQNGAPLPLLPVQYADYATWQRTWLSGERLQRQLDYWTAQLAGVPPLLQWPLERPRPPLQRYRGAARRHVLPAVLGDAARALALQHQASLFMVLAAAFSALLARYCNQDDICIGTPNANRARPELAGLIGFFVNTQVLRARVDPAASFRTLLLAMRETVLGAFAHPDLPFEQLVDALKPVRDLSHAPLFQVMLVLDTTADSAVTLPELTLRGEHAATTVAKFDLTLNVFEADGALHCSFEYNVDLFDAPAIERLARHFHGLLAAAVAQPDEPLHRLSLFGRDERSQLLATGEDRSRSGDAMLAHRRFEAGAALHPERVALVSAAASLTYAQLNTRANRLAHWLRTQGVGTETVVGLHAGRSIETIGATPVPPATIRIGRAEPRR